MLVRAIARRRQPGSGMDTRDRIPRDAMMEIVDDPSGMGVTGGDLLGWWRAVIYPSYRRGGDPIGVGWRADRRLDQRFDAQRTSPTPSPCMAPGLRVSIDGWDGPSYACSRKVDFGEFDKVIGNLTAFSRRGFSPARWAPVSL